jgi:hypothetical protein
VSRRGVQIQPLRYQSSEGIEVVVDWVEVDPDHIWHQVPGAVVT